MRKDTNRSREAGNLDEIQAVPARTIGIIIPRNTFAHPFANSGPAAAIGLDIGSPLIPP